MQAAVVTSSSGSDNDLRIVVDRLPLGRAENCPTTKAAAMSVRPPPAAPAPPVKQTQKIVPLVHLFLYLLLEKTVFCGLGGRKVCVFGLIASKV